MRSSYHNLTNPLIDIEQLVDFRAKTTLESQNHSFAVALLTQSAGVLLRLPQDTIASSLVLLQRYQVCGQSSEQDANTIAAATLYLAAKVSFTPVSHRSVINVFAYLTSSAWVAASQAPAGPPLNPDPRSYYVSEGTYERRRLALCSAEVEVLAALGFDIHVSLPHPLALTYLQTLGISSSRVTQRVVEHLNGTLVSPQMIYLSQQPNAIAVAAIYLATRECGAKLVEENWWEVFDVDREDLGFCVMAMGSLGNYAEAQSKAWTGSIQNDTDADTDITTKAI